MVGCPGQEETLFEHGFEPLSNPTAYTAADVLIFRRVGAGPLDVEILTHRRQRGWWEGDLMISVGGFSEPTDQSPLQTALREAAEEAPGIEFRLTRYLGTFGPERYAATIHFRMSDGPRLVVHGNSADCRPVIWHVFLAEHVRGDPKPNKETGPFTWVRLRDLDGKRIGYDGASALFTALRAGFTPAPETLELVHHFKPGGHVHTESGTIFKPF